MNLANVLDGGDAITFDKSVFKKAKTITLTDGPLDISNTTGPISITGTTKKLTISGGGTIAQQGRQHLRPRDPALSLATCGSPRRVWAGGHRTSPSAPQSGSLTPD
jgi:hypothetical protein